MKKIVEIILVILILTNFAIIFNFSEQNATESQNLSRKVTLFVLNIWGNYQEPLNETQEQIAFEAECIIRKLAHFTIYVFLGLFLMGLMYMFKLQNKTRIGISLAIAITYASLDEFHQSFVPGRTPLITDVFIDTAGAVVGIYICYYFLCKIKTRKVNTQKIDKDRVQTNKWTNRRK